MTSRLGLRSLVLACVLLVFVAASPASAQLGSQRATGKPTSLQVTVKKVELWNGTSWVTLFTGSAQLNLVQGGTFPGIASLSFPAGTYSKIRITVTNAFPVTGSLTYSVPYFVTSLDGPAAGATALASPVSSGPYSFYNSLWGSKDADYVLDEFIINPAITVGPSTDYQPTLKFNVDNALQLWEYLGTFYFTMGAPVVSIQ